MSGRSFFYCCPGSEKRFMHDESLFFLLLRTAIKKLAPLILENSLLDQHNENTEHHVTGESFERCQKFRQGP